MIKPTRILILAPHTDDGELGCGGSIARFLEEKNDVHYVAFSTCSESLPKGLHKDTLKRELKAATRNIGIKPENLIVFDYTVRKLNYVRQEILEDLVKIKANINPDIIFIPSSNDVHQDHQTISTEGLRAFKTKTILGYELPWNTITFHAQHFIKLEKKHVEAKIKALENYKSQEHRDYFNKDFLMGWSKMRGTQIGSEYAEAFDVLRWVI